MTDVIAAMFRRPDWRLSAGKPDEPPSLLDVIYLQAAWRHLSKAQRRALDDLVAGRLSTIRASTGICLVRHGLLDEDGAVTDTGRLVVKYRPTELPVPARLQGRPVTDVHLPQEVTP